jgi:hypothetical protein
MRLRVVDPAKIVAMDLILVCDKYKGDSEFKFGSSLQMFYKILKSLDNEESLAIESDGSYMKIDQTTRYHTMTCQDIPPIPVVDNCFDGSKILVGTKMFQKYLRAIGNVAPSFELNYVPSSGTLFIESVNSMYRTMFAIEPSSIPNDDSPEYRKAFMVRFVDMALNPSLSDKVEITLGDHLNFLYDLTNMSVIVTVAHTDA